MFGLFGRSGDKTAANSLYEAAQEAARQPVLFAAYGVPDTLEGRFEMLALHLAVLLDRLGKGDDGVRRLSKPLTERFVIDMDDAMRDFGVGDLSVPRKVKKAAAALYDRHRAYGAAISAGGAAGAWTQALQEQLAGLGGHERADVGRLGAYAARMAPHLAALADGDLAAGRISFPVAQNSAQT